MTYIPEALRRLVAERAGDRCEYCQMHEDDTFFTHEVDHIYAEKHDGPTVEWNLCLACAECNRNKGSDICSLDPETGNVVALFHPRRDRWADHFLRVDTGVIEPLTAHGRVTARLLRMNRLDLVADRARLIALRPYPGEES
ncbi:HNH endonuclease [Candidatus Chloroploca sp. M-50]|uniref:HNH endonuclease n=1 Tax=Candidatus Chloroploca mongolica TaxID=2528176 RepID=A0ABS4D6V3_9CHLR|nr:HNH endonuclease signature motif containing protein [Candidatus Chloroploca mongolica]MBP1465145.1 HNH endonuclease [Candidatus Chloroploca mongolica]